MQLTFSTLLSRVGTQMFAVLIVLFVLQTYHSPGFSGIVILCSQLPGILVSPIAGALLDRGTKVPLMGLDYGIEAAAIATIGALSLAHDLTRPLLLGIALLGSFTQPLSRVGARTIYPIIVPAQLWDRTNALDSASQLIALVLGPSAAGFSVALIGPRVAMLVVAGAFALAALSLYGVVIPAPEQRPSESLLIESRDAVVYVFRNKVLRMLAASVTLTSLAQNALLIGIPVLVLRRIHGSSTAVGLVIAAFGLAGFAAGFILGRVGTAGRERAVIGWCCFVSAGAYVAMAPADNYLLLVAMIAIVGAGSGLITVAMFSLRQRATEPQWYGRAFAVSMNLNYGLTPIGAAVVGAMVAHSIAAAFIFMGIVIAIGGLFPAFSSASTYEPEHDHSLSAPGMEGAASP